MKDARGFTMVELVVTLAVAAILLALAVPSFRDMIATNRISGTATEMLTALNLARGEAIKRNGLVTVSSASGTNDWSSGWTVAVPAGEQLRSYAAVTGDQTLTGTTDAVQFNGRGALESAGTPTFDICDGRTGETGRRVEIERTGRARTLDLDC